MINIQFCGKQIKEQGWSTCGVTAMKDLRSNDYGEGEPNYIFICEECLRKFEKKEVK